jgi:hypothetical protein
MWVSRRNILEDSATPSGIKREWYVCKLQFARKYVYYTAAYYFDGRCGVVVGILAYYARGRGFDSRTVQTFVCKNMSVLGLGISMYNMYVFTKENVYKYVLIRYLESITQHAEVAAYRPLTYGISINTKTWSKRYQSIFPKVR